MKLNFEYNHIRDAWCILNFGKTSSNSDYITESYKLLENNNKLDQKSAESFLDKYISENRYLPNKCVQIYKENFKIIEQQYTEIAENIFGVKIDYDITVCLTLNQRYPYGIEERLFFVPFPKDPSDISNAVIMHELWHFYTWEKFNSQIKEIGDEKYNIIKESLTVLLNIECKHLFLENETDKGYPQHQELRKQIIRWWEEKPSIEHVWSQAIKKLS
jgi:hypothetical protein